MLEKYFNHTQKEKEWYNLWESSGFFSAQPETKDKPYTIMMPPPNVTGNLHIGHALTFTLQDILIRFHKKLGKNVLWQPGTDHAGIATEIVVRKTLHAKGVRFRIHAKDLPGKPDIVIRKYKLAIQVNGCFWHQHSGCLEKRIPDSNKKFWKFTCNNLK